MPGSRWSLLDPDTRRRWKSAARREARRWLNSAIYFAQGVSFRIERSLKSARPVQAKGQEQGKRILFVDDLLPDPLFGAGYPRAFVIIRSLLAAGHRVEHYPMSATSSDLARMSAAFENAVRFHPGSGAHGLRRLLWEDGQNMDILFVSRPGPMAALLAARWRPSNRPPIIYDAEAVMAPRDQRRDALFGTSWSDRKYRAALAAELSLAQEACAVTAVGRGDADLISSVLKVPVFVLPHSVDRRRDAPGPDGRKDILFVGRLTGAAATSPNVDSVRWFVTEIMPRLDRLIGTGYRLQIAGRLDAPEIARLASDRVVFNGIVEDLRPLYDGARVFVAPTRYAAGIPLKVLDAMAEGIPCVATTLLARQLGTDPGTLAAGADADAFAQLCAHLYNDDEAWLSAQQAGFAFVDRIGSPDAFDGTLADLIDHACKMSATERLSS